MKIIYVAGPYTSPEGEWGVRQNVKAAEEVALELWKMGFAVICPHKNTGGYGGILTWQQIMAGDLAIVERCDALVMLPGWEYSKGSCMERNLALETGRPVFYSEEDGVIERLQAFQNGEEYETIHLQK